ncbi:MAG: RidA family protein [Candidatus Omnitrophica bacterium]|nr:RidA family protein [Candidatus Omnitrophota bacterium]
MMNYETRLKELKIELPEAPKSVGSYTPVVIQGTTAYLSGQVSKYGTARFIQGRIGKDLTLEQGQEAARLAALNVISLIRSAIGFDKLDRILRVVGYVNADPSFYEIPQVVNGASDLLVLLFQDQGIHARSSVGVASLPMNAAVEIEVTLQLKA